MPRSAWSDVPNVLQHVMARGIEGREISRDKKDREEFLRRLRGGYAGESMSSLGRLCGFAQTSLREAIERAREERDEGH